METDAPYLVEIDVLQKLNCQGHCDIPLARIAQCYEVDPLDESALQAAGEQVLVAIKAHFPNVTFEIITGHVRFLNARH